MQEEGSGTCIPVGPIDGFFTVANIDAAWVSKVTVIARCCHCKCDAGFRDLSLRGCDPQVRDRGRRQRRCNHHSIVGKFAGVACFIKSLQGEVVCGFKAKVESTRHFNHTTRCRGGDGKCFDGIAIIIVCIDGMGCVVEFIACGWLSLNWDASK